MTSEKPASLHVGDCTCQGRGCGSSSGAGGPQGSLPHESLGKLTEPSLFFLTENGAGDGHEFGGHASGRGIVGGAHEFGGRASGRGSIRRKFDDPALFAVPDLVGRLKA